METPDSMSELMINIIAVNLMIVCRPDMKGA